MKLVVQVKLLPTPQQAAALEATLDAANRAANLVAALAFQQRCFRNFDLRKHTYDQIKAEFGLAAHRRGESDLICRDGMWFLYATVEVADRLLSEPDGFVGVDLGIANIATTSDGVRHCGKGLNAVRHRHRRLRRRLQIKRTKSAKRLLKRRRRSEARFAANVNHIIAKSIVTEAERTGRGIALEDLEGIRERVRLRKPQRVTLHSWSFHQLGGFIGYKAHRAGVAVIHVDPAYTSQQCSSCGHVDKRNRPDQATFSCTSCGFAEHADVNAARNIASRGETGWAVSHAA